MQKEKQNKVFKYYQKVTVGIAVRLFNNMIENDGVDMITMLDLENFSADLVNKFTACFMSQDQEKDEPTYEDIEENKNVVREELLKLASYTSLIPDDELVIYCCKECVGLIYYTNQLEEE